MKTCTKCGEVKPLDAFHRERRTSDGRRSDCKSCVSDRMARHYAENKAEHSERSRLKRERNYEQYRAREKAYAANNPDKRAETYEKYRSKPGMPETLRVRARRYRQENPDRYRDVIDAWLSKNPEYRGSWRTANRDAVAESARRYRARKRAATVGSVDLATLWDAQKGACGLCALPIDLSLRAPDPHSPSVDHIVPLSKGGTHEHSNLQWTHLVCNQRKGASVPEPQLVRPS